MRSMAFLFVMSTACALITCAYAERVECALTLGELFAKARGESSKQLPPKFRTKKEAFLSVYRAATEGLSIKELQGLSRQPFDFKDFVDASNLSRAHEKLMVLKNKVLPSFSTKEQKNLMRAIQIYLVERISHAQKSQESWSEIREESASDIVKIFAGHKGWVTSVAFSPDSKRLASIDTEGEVKICNLENTKVSPVTFKGSGEAKNTIAFSPDGTRLAVTSSWNNQIRLWSLKNKKVRPITLSGHRSWITSLAFSPDGHTLASGSYDRTIRLWNLNSDTSTPLVLEGLTGIVNSVVFSPDGKFLASSGDYGVRIFNLSRPQPTSITVRDRIYRGRSVAFSPNGKFLASCSVEQMIYLWNLTNHPPTFVEFEAHKKEIASVVFSPDGNFLASGSHDKNIRLWNLKNKNFEANPITLTGHTNVVFSIAFSPDGYTLASGSADETVRVWNIRKLLGRDPLEEDTP